MLANKLRSRLMVKGKRRLMAFLSLIACITAVEITNPITGGGLSAFGQGAYIAAAAAYFGNVAVDKYKNGRSK